MQEKRYLIQKIKKYDEEIKEETKTLICSTLLTALLAMQFFASCYGKSPSPIEALISIGFGVPSVVFTAHELIKKTALSNKKFDLECDLRYIEKEEEHEEEKVLRR